ncbi:MAG: hypothetical protein GX762_03955, partial [Bacteroidales bacterium]|nr:hypothetical protein [Bacteroidales bacterium]
DSLKLSRNEEMFNQKVTQFYAAIENNEELSNALASLKFSPYLNKLKAVHEEMQSVITAKLISIAKRPKETTAQLTKVVLTAIRNMVKQIEIAPVLNPTLNYGPLYNEMNQLLTEYRDMISKRASINKRKAEKIENEQEESIEVTITTESEEPVETVLPMNVDEISAYETEPQPFGVENAVAMSSRIMQLHRVYDNGD